MTYKKRKRSILVAIEGIDQSGKQTQSRLLANKLRQCRYSVGVISFPNYTTEIGRQLRRYLNGNTRLNLHAAHMLYAANKWESLPKLNQKIGSVDVLILNRYRASNLAYGTAHGLPFKWLSMLEDGLPEPDLVVVLDVSPRLSFERKRKNRDLHEKEIAYLRKVRQVYLRLARGLRWTVVNGERERKIVHSKIWSTVSLLLR